MKEKTFFIVFEGLSFGEKNKILIKNSGHKLKKLVSPLFQTDLKLRKKLFLA